MKESKQMNDELERLRAHCAALTLAGTQAYKALVSAREFILRRNGALNPHRDKAIDDLKAVLDLVFNDFGNCEREEDDAP